jgi:hypothetical protein
MQWTNLNPIRYPDITPQQIFNTREIDKNIKNTDQPLTSSFYKTQILDGAEIIHLDKKISDLDLNSGTLGITNLKIIGNLTDIKEICLYLNSYILDKIYPIVYPQTTFDLVDKKILPILKFFKYMLFCSSSINNEYNFKVQFDIVALSVPIGEKDELSLIYKFNKLDEFDYKEYYSHEIFPLRDRGPVEKLYIKSETPINARLYLSNFFYFRIGEKITEMEYIFEEPINFSSICNVYLKFLSEDSTKIFVITTGINILTVSHQGLCIKFS